MDIPDEELWAARELLKRKLKGAMLDWAQRLWSEAEVMPQQVLAMGSLLHPELAYYWFCAAFR